MSVGIIEIVVVLLIGFICLAVPLAVGVLAFFSLKKKQGAKAAALYACPTCGVRGSAPGTCTQCGMALVKQQA